MTVIQLAEITPSESLSLALQRQFDRDSDSPSMFSPTMTEGWFRSLGTSQVEAC
jgi:hypothetical protein